MKHTKQLRIAGLVALVAVLSVGGGYVGSLLGRSHATPVMINDVGSFSSGDGSGGGSAMRASLSTSGMSQEVSLAFQDRFREVARDTLPVVVELNVVSTVTQQVPTNPFFYFFGPQQGRQATPQERQYQQRGLGSGVLVGKNNDTVYVLTNNHVVGEADEIEVVLNDGRSYTGSLIGTDSMMDLALVSFETEENIPIATLGDSESLQPGDWVFAVGNPLGFQSTVTAGIVSALERNAQAGSGMSGVTSYIQTDAAINRGNSGGALVNLNGEVVGINTWIASQNGGSIGLGFAIPINMAKRAINDFITTGTVSYSWLGVLAGSADENSAETLGIADREGAFVYSVYLDSPAGMGGIEAGDLITRVGDTEITGADDLVRTIATLPPDQRVRVTVIRDGVERSLFITTTRRSEDAGSDAAMLWPGFSATALSDDLRQRLETPDSVRGVVVASVATGTSAETSGLRQGDVIMAINGETVRDIQDFYDTLSGTSTEELSFRLRRGKQTLILYQTRSTYQF